MEQPQPFYVGLCLAGAVSAGAYTAGVMDFLIEALEEWEVNRGKPGIPNHRVKIPVIGGASAGGMTAIITASAINNKINPVNETADLKSKHPENKFWHTWVDMIDEDMFPHLLNTNDIKKAHILSLFNSSFIDTIANRALAIQDKLWIERPYFENNLKIFTTLTNLRGLSYNIDFRGSNSHFDPYCVTTHNDYVNFRLNTTHYQGDGWLPLHFKESISVALARDAAMATGAFPIGLRARYVGRNKEALNDNEWLKPITTINPVLHDVYEALHIDGGMINNEPFEKVRDVLCSITGQTSDQYNNYNQFTSTVLMVDPFPSKPSIYNSSDKLLHVLGSTFSALINQVRVKPHHLVNAMDSDKAGQFLIAPKRKVPQVDGAADKAEVGDSAIACGALEGFSGFLHKDFRIHDYFLGRANCEKFLRDHFTVPVDSTNLITDGYTHISEEQRKRFYASDNKKLSFPIIPVVVPRKERKYMPLFTLGSSWPVCDEYEIDRYRDEMQKRVYALIMNIADYSWWMKAFMSVGAWTVLKRRLTHTGLEFIKQSLANHHLIKSNHYKPKTK